MDQVNKHWKPLAAGVTAVAMAGLVYYYLVKETSVHQMIEDVEETSKAVSADTWPNMHRIIDPELSKVDQDAQFNLWVGKVFSKYIEKHGSFKTDKEGRLQFDDFMNVYALVEIKARLDMSDSRNSDMERKIPLFKNAFYTEQSGEEATESKEKYVDLLIQLIDHECALYGPVLNEVLSMAKVNQTVWEFSVDKHLSVGKEYAIRASNLCVNSPFAYIGNKSYQEILDIYTKAVDFAIHQICHSADKDGECIFHII
jgi:hypothetical protein